MSSSESPTREHVVLVNERDEPIGTAEKYRAHAEGLLHRAFSACIYNSRGEMLLQQRHPAKYHSGGLWSNTVCSHPRPDEELEEAVSRRLVEEMGLRCPLHHAFRFRYRTHFENGLTEHELDHVFIGFTDGDPVPDEHEVAAWRWVAPVDLAASMRAEPQRYTTWFRLIAGRLPRYVERFAA